MESTSTITIMLFIAVLASRLPDSTLKIIIGAGMIIYGATQLYKTRKERN